MLPAEPMVSGKMVDVSIVVVSWNTSKILHDCLESIYAHIENLAFEVIVVDNASSDDSVEMVKRDFPDAISLQNSHNKGFAAANNKGISVAKGRYILLLNSDSLVLDKAIDKTVSFADKHPKAAVVTCKVLNPDKTLQDSYFMFPSILNMLLSATFLNKLFPRSRFFGRVRMTWCDWSDVREVDVVAGCFMLVRREAIEQVGMMDEQFFMYAEETDWCYRFKQAGWKIIYAPVGEIVHLEGQSANLQSETMLLQLLGSTLYFMKKQRSWPEYVLSCILMSLHFAMRIPFWVVKAATSTKKKDAQRRCHIYAKAAVLALLGWNHLCVKRKK